MLGGWSFGGLWALEVYKQLKDRRKIKYLAIVDSLQPGVELDTIEEFTLKEEKGIVQKYISPLIDLESVTDTEMLWHIVIQYFRENVDSFEKFKNSFGNLSFVLQESEPEECIKKFNLFRTLSNAQTKYREIDVSYSVPALLVKGTKSYINMNLEKWKNIFRHHQILEYPVDHKQIIQNTVASRWIEELNKKI